jgi:hypothetical protein
MAKPSVGGSFSPPLSDAKLADYRSAIELLQPKSRLREALEILLNCCEQWWEQPESTGSGRPHPVGIGLIVDLDDSIAAALWEHIPWNDELDAFQKLFDAIEPADATLRNMAFHLLWHARELALDREPMTNDKL